jgi:hypothetical protein
MVFRLLVEVGCGRRGAVWLLHFDDARVQMFELPTPLDVTRISDTSSLSNILCRRLGFFAESMVVQMGHLQPWRHPRWRIPP